MDSGVFTTILGLCALFGLVGYRHFSHQRTGQRLMRLWEEAEKAQQEGRLDDAERALAQAVALEGLWTAARQRLAQVHALQGKLDQAEQELKFAASLRPREPEGPFVLAAYYAQFRPGQQQEVLRHLRHAFDLHPRAANLLREHREVFAILEEEAPFQELLLREPVAE